MLARRTFQTLFGLAIGVAARLLLPGHPSVRILAATAYSPAGAIVGELAGEGFLPHDSLRVAGFAASALGAISALLASGLVAYSL